jgi:hypothetical protein
MRNKKIEKMGYNKIIKFTEKNMWEILLIMKRKIKYNK